MFKSTPQHIGELIHQAERLINNRKDYELKADEEKELSEAIKEVYKAIGRAASNFEKVKEED